MPRNNRKYNRKSHRARYNPGDLNSSSDEIREVHVIGKIEGHGGIAKGGPFIPTPNFHIHRSGISICGTLYLYDPKVNEEDNNIILKALDDGIHPKAVIDKWVDSMNIRQISYNLNAPKNENTSKEFFIKHFGVVQGEKIHQNVMLGYEMAAQGIPGLFTENLYGESEHLADKSFGGRQAGDLPHAFVPETTPDGPALCIYGVYVKNEYRRVAQCITLRNGVKMSDLHIHVRSMQGIKETDVVHFHFLDTTCNFDDLNNSCGSFPLVSYTNREIMRKKYIEYLKKANKINIDEVGYIEVPRRKYSFKNIKNNNVFKPKSLKVSAIAKRRLARAKARAEPSTPTPPTPKPEYKLEAIAEDSGSSARFVLRTPPTPTPPTPTPPTPTPENSGSSARFVLRTPPTPTPPTHESNSHPSISDITDDFPLDIPNKNNFSKYRDKKSSS
jgi:hypothetical protein